MSYCRHGPDSDVYVIGHTDGFECVNCREKDEHVSWYGKDHGELFHHLLVDHIAKGHKVPNSAMDRIVMEQTHIANDAHNAQSAEILSMLLFKLTLPGAVFKHLAGTGRAIDEINTELEDVLNYEFADLNWPPEDDD